ncbi:hypothetical protein [Marinobacterium litorale]|uniref:hypothetical protein n=1 Tax=Marinobacterium litorale TaxID=404770 RepID=UPI0006873806|nr:hypothetical protein [Marinobacterium litorale]
MLLSDIFSHLTEGELSQYFFGTGENGQIDPADYPKIISQINLGLTNLHTRLPLKQQEVIVDQQVGNSIYTLHSDFAVSNTGSTEPVKYIIDTADEPFEDNILVIERVYMEDGTKLPLNDADSAMAVYTPKYNVIQIPFETIGSAVSIIYRADHPRIPTDIADPTTFEVDLSFAYLEPLLYYVGSRITGSFQNQEAVQNSGFLYSKYEKALLDIQNSNLLQNETINNTKLEMRGWV